MPHLTYVDTPAYSYFDSLWTTPLNWGFYTVAQPNANDREIYWPRGKVLGGSSAINGLYMTRPGENEINAWQSMLGDMDGAENWSWDSFYTAMKKSETFSPPTDDVKDQADITWDSSTHGSDGPIHASYPGLYVAIPMLCHIDYQLWNMEYGMLTYTAHSTKSVNGPKLVKISASPFQTICTVVRTGAQKFQPPASIRAIGLGHTVGPDTLTRYLIAETMMFSPMRMSRVFFSTVHLT